MGDAGGCIIDALPGRSRAHIIARRGRGGALRASSRNSADQRARAGVASWVAWIECWRRHGGSDAHAGAAEASNMVRAVATVAAASDPLAGLVAVVAAVGRLANLATTIATAFASTATA
jgi:hypothetical protein